jgi:predicted small metal-binding protein
MPGEEFVGEEPMLELPNATEVDHARHIGAGVEMGPEHYVHCSDLHGDKGCAMAMTGDEAEVIKEAIQHVTLFHHEPDTPTLRERITERVRHMRRKRD